MGGRWIVGGLIAATLSIAASAAQAVEIIDFEDLPLGPVSGVTVIDQHLGGGGTIVDTGGGNQAYQLSGQFPRLFFIATVRTGPNTEAVYHLLSLDFMVSRRAFYSTQGPTLTSWIGGIAPAGEWINWDVSPGGGTGGLTWNPNSFGTSMTVLVDNVTYEFVGVRAVPEPSTWALMIGGFGLIGWRLRGRRGSGPSPRLAAW